MNAAPPTTITTDADGWFQSVSPSFLELVDRPIEALAGLNLIDLVHPHDAPDARRLLAAIASGNTATTTDLRMFTAGETWTALHLAVQGVGDGRVILDASRVALEPAVDNDPFVASAPAVAPTPTAPPAVVRNPEPEPVAEAGAADAYRDAIPGDEVPMQRAAIRARVGTSRTPMIEIDNEGRTTFVGGEWDKLFPYDTPETLDGQPGEELFERILDASDSIESVMAAIGGVLDLGLDSKHQISVAGVGARWVHILSIPSPHQARVVNALIAVSASSTLAELDVTPIEPPPARQASAVPPAAMQALGRITNRQAK